MHLPLTARALRSFSAGSVCLFALACKAPQSKTIDTSSEVKPIADIVEAANNPNSIGKFLADLDASIRAWNKLTLTAQSEEDRRKASLLERSLMFETHKRRDELIQELETGPLNNRVVAASALGFTRDVEAQGPLLAALNDSQTEVVSNALLGLALLGRADTPLDDVCRLLQDSKDDWVRSNAALCLASLVKVGARSECAVQAGRMGLLDDEPAVRSQSAMILATVNDRESIGALVDRLYDSVPLVGAAAARALAFIGTQNPPDKGTAARALATAYEEQSGSVKGAIQRALLELAGANYGSDSKGWSEWANRLP